MSLGLAPSTFWEVYRVSGVGPFLSLGGVSCVFGVGPFLSLGGVSCVFGVGPFLFLGGVSCVFASISVNSNTALL